MVSGEVYLTVGDGEAKVETGPVLVRCAPVMLVY